MTTDAETNFVYFSNLIRIKPQYRYFWLRLEKILKENNIDYDFIEGTKDIWCRDYMPVQINKNNFVEFKFDPSYLHWKKYDKKRTTQKSIKYDKVIQKEEEHKILVDGGNVVKSKNRVILTDMIFRDNKAIKKDEQEKLKTKLKSILKIEHIYVIPRLPTYYDFTGHADGMVRFLNDDTILVNDFKTEDEINNKWKEHFKLEIEKTGLNVHKFYYLSSKEQNECGDYTAIGCYINFAQIGTNILFPQFGYSKQDEMALAQIKEYFPKPKYTIIPVDSLEIALYGGVLNCATWNCFFNQTT